MEKIYGYFCYPDTNDSYFSVLTSESVDKRPMDDRGGCMFTVNEDFIEKLQIMLNDSENMGHDVFIEISGDADHVFVDREHNSVIGYIILPKTSNKKKLEIVRDHRKFNSTFMAAIMGFDDFRRIFKVVIRN